MRSEETRSIRLRFSTGMDGIWYVNGDYLELLYVVQRPSDARGPADSTWSRSRSLSIITARQN